MSEPEYTNTWFEQHVQHIWEERLLPMDYPIRYLEIGVCEGRSMRWVLENLCVEEAVGVDSWRPRRKKEQHVMPLIKERAFSNLKPWPDELRLIEDSSHTMVPTLPLKHFDLVYIDGDHRAPEAMLDVCNCFRVLKVGGTMLIDDLQKTWVRGRPQVLPVVHAIPTLFHGRLEQSWREGRQIAFRKVDA